MTSTSPDFELLDEVMARIEAEPERHFPGSWRGELDGAEDAYCVRDDEERLWADPEDPIEDRCYSDNDKPGSPSLVTVDTRAKRLLGLDAYAARALFAGYNSLESIKAMVAELKAGRKGGYAADLLPVRLQNPLAGLPWNRP